MPDIETVLRKIIEQTRNRNIKWKELEVGFEANIKEARIVFDSSGIFGIFTCMSTFPIKFVPQ